MLYVCMCVYVNMCGKKIVPLHSLLVAFLFQEPWAMGWAIFMAYSLRSSFFIYFEEAVEDGWPRMRKRREPCEWSGIKL